MKILSPDAQSEFDLLQNEYIVNQKQVKSQLAIFARQRNLACVFGILCLFISIGILIGAMVIAHEAKKIDKVVFKEDGTGGLTYLGNVNNSIALDPKRFINSQLDEYITALYSVPPEHELRQYYTNKVISMTDVNYYSQQIKAIFQDAYVKHSSDTITIKISSIGEVAKGVWEIDWTQFNNNNKSGDYKTNVTFNQVTELNNDNLNDAQMMQLNPLNIAITNVNTFQRVVSQ